MLEIRGLEVLYGGACAIADVTARIGHQEFVSVVGANGAGKTTLIRAIAGMVASRAGSIRFKGHEIRGLSNAEVCELGIAQVPEGRQIFPNLTVAENLWLGGSLKRAKRSRKNNLERVYEAFPRLLERRKQKAGSLSGGEQQMLAIGRCIMADPELVMLDEPSLGLSPIMTELVFEMVRKLNEDGATILLVEQNVAESLLACDRGYVIENGVTVLEGDGTVLLNDTRIKQAYLGL